MADLPRVVRGVIVVIGVVGLGACLLEDVRHNLYLEADGGLTWTVLEDRVRSNRPDTPEGVAEESAFVRDAATGAHGVAEALFAIGAECVSSRVLRDRRPFAVWSEGRFSSVAGAGQHLVEGLGLDGSFEASSDASGGRLQLEVVVTEAEPTDDRLIELLADPERYRLILVRGRFTSAEGFELSEEETVAVPLEPMTEPKLGETLRWSLAWTTTPVAEASREDETGGPPSGDPPVDDH